MYLHGQVSRNVARASRKKEFEYDALQLPLANTGRELSAPL